MSFIILLIVGLSALVSVETQRASSSQKQLEARSNALLALKMAVGQLQQHVGPDQRITAPSDINEASNPNSDNHSHWTGVWRQAPGSNIRSPALLTWLVSGNENGIDLTPSTTIAEPTGVTSSSVWLVGDGSVDNTDKQIKLPKQSVLNRNGTASGHYAWWTGDEGAKAHLALVDPAEIRPDNERIYSFLAAQRSGGELIEDAENTLLGSHYPANNSELNNVVSPAQLPLATTDVNTVLTNTLRSRFHDVTVSSESLLVDTAQGGLKKDLSAWLNSAPNSVGPDDEDFIISPIGNDEEGLPRWGLIRSYNSIRENGSIALAARNQSETEHGLYPVITYANLGFNLSCSGQDMSLQVRLFPEVVIWNPYNVPIAAATYECGMGVSNPTNRAINFEVDGNTKTTLYLNKAVLDNSSAPSRAFSFTLEAPEIPPGASLLFSLSDTEHNNEYTHGENIMTADSTPGINSVAMTPAVGSGASIHFTEDGGDLQPATVTWNFLGNSGRLNAALRLKPSVPDNAEGFTFGDDALHIVDAVGYSATSGSQDTLVAAGQEASGTHYNIFLEIAMRGGASNARMAWVSQSNFRAPESKRFGRDSENPAYYANDSPATLTTPVAPNANSSYWRASTGELINSPSGKAQDTVLAEFQPSGVPLFSIAQLQHANLSLISGYPTYPVGNSLAPIRIALDATSDTQMNYGAGIDRTYDIAYLLNEQLWDRYFFSTLPSNLTQAELDAGYQAPNSRLAIEQNTTLTDLIGTGAYNTAAEKLTIRGGFNINSTSENAWRALFASLNGLAYDPVERQVSNSLLDSPFSRYALPQYDTETTWDASYRQLTEEQIEDLAQRMVEEIRERGPFLSLADFVNRRLVDGEHGFKGPLQAAIDQQSSNPATGTTGINALSDFPTGNLAGVSSYMWGEDNYFLPQLQGGENAELPAASRFAFAPSYLTQADMLSALGPVLTARSDTFLIRTYGDATNPTTGNVEGRAWCEAIVQRTSDYIDQSLDASALPTSGSNNERFGRNFRILSIRWLTENEV
ncbi:hypothetical protein QEH59_09445 [Coraliomargarita sp. SDUM461004]|uniref:Uncharacterized protein n=2 Tax=Thalassobacterium sedimentorum TaxID=3041258 RepID=A0ABU1ALC3_9BACT|nr:hypothetical protein [Coraliomargarita sp. SDUM461004]